MTFTNDLQPSVFISSKEVRVPLWTSVPLQLRISSNPLVTFMTRKPVRTPNPRRLDTLTVLSIPGGTVIDNYCLKSVLLVQLRRVLKESLAVTWLEGVAEYGTGKEDESALMDLVISLGEYREALEKREQDLGDSAKRDLDKLRRLIERSDNG